MPIQAVPMSNDPDVIAAELDEILKDVQGMIHDQWDWMQAHFLVECLRCMVHDARAHASPVASPE